MGWLSERKMNCFIFLPVRELVGGITDIYEVIGGRSTFDHFHIHK